MMKVLDKKYRSFHSYVEEMILRRVLGHFKKKGVPLSKENNFWYKF